VKYHLDHVEQDIRPDNREFLEFRPTIINKNSFSRADGSALVKIGNTTVVCGIKAELSEPDNLDQNIGFIIPNIELTKLCSPKYRAIGVSIESQLISQALFNIIINSECIDPTELCIVKGKLVWALYCDMICLDDDGSVLDVAVIALSTALKSLKLPKVDYDMDTKTIKVDDKVKSSLRMKCIPVASTFVTFKNRLLVDPTADEEGVSDTTVTIAMSDGNINYIHQPGGNSLEQARFDVILKQAASREKYIKSLVNAI
jgi:exosome complex component RRP43